MHDIYHVMYIASTPDICWINETHWSIVDLSWTMGDPVRTRKAFEAASEFLNPALQRGMQYFTIMKFS